VQQTYYTAFNPTVVQSTTKNCFSLCDVPSTCFGINVAILREVSFRGIQQWQVLLKMYIYGVKNAVLSIKVSKNI
jgi:hypothetical protein